MPRDYCGLARAAWVGLRERRRLERDTWRLYRRLLKSEPADLAEIEPLLAPADGRTPAGAFGNA
jgi:hypothetical protein